MNKSHIPQGIAAFAAIVMTLVIVNSVVSLADEDKAALATAQSGKNTALASSTGSVRRSTAAAGKADLPAALTRVARSDDRHDR